VIEVTATPAPDPERLLHSVHVSLVKVVGERNVAGLEREDVDAVAVDREADSPYGRKVVGVQDAVNSRGRDFHHIQSHHSMHRAAELLCLREPHQPAIQGLDRIA
jgi:hypothetical protein